MIRNFVYSIALAGTLSVLLVLNGCAAASIATAGTVAGLAASAVSTGADVYHLGKLDSVEMAKEAEMNDALHRMVTDLGLHIVLKQHEGTEWYYRLDDDQGTTTGVTLDRLTPTMSSCRINVGLFGSEPRAKLMLFRIRAHLPLPPERLQRRVATQPSWPTDPRGPVDDVDRTEP
jgi:hypothetical protein